MKKYKILAVEWRSSLHTVGFVAYESFTDGEWNSVVGYVPDYIEAIEVGNHFAIHGGENQETDAQYIAANGAKIEWNVARELFPQLDITKHKYFPEELRDTILVAKG